MPRRTSRTVIASAAGLALAACSSSMPLRPDYEPEADLEGATTYVWAPAPAGAVADVDPELEGRVRTAVGAELARMGFVQGNVDADMRVRAWLVDEAPPASDAIFVDVLSPEGSTVWQGTASLDVHAGQARGERYAQIRDAVGEALDDFSP